MEPISGLAALYGMLRRKIAGGDRTSGRSTKEVRETARTQAERVSLLQLEQRIRAKLAAEAPESLMSAASKRWVIASLLAWEYDDRVQNEPRFNDLVRTVQQSIDRDAALKAKLERVMQQLSR